MRRLAVPRWAEHTLALAVPSGLFLALNLRALGGWWIHDDPCLLAAVLRSGIASHFWQPEVWRALSGTVLMPWNLLSLGVDARLFGLVPAAFYAHQLLAFGVLLAAAYALLRARLSAWSTSLALALFVTSVPAFAVAQQLMNRHYLEGLIFVLGALACYLRAVRTGRAGFAVAGAGLYLLATTAKEVFVPLVAAVPFVPAGELRARLRHAWPFAAAAALYVPWRLYMLGWANSLSGYAARSDRGMAGDVAAIPALVGLERPWQLAVAALAAGAALVAVGRRRRRLLGLCAAVAAVVVLPLLPVLGQLGPRHFFLPALGVAVLIGGALDSHRGAWRGVAAGVGLALVLLQLHVLTVSSLWRRLGRTVELHRTEGSFILESPEDGILLTRIGDPLFLGCLAEIRRDALRQGGGPGFCGDACWCADAFPEASFWHDDGGQIAAAEPPRAPCAEERDLWVEMRYDRTAGRLAWSLGPYGEGDGSYQILLVTDADRPQVSAPVPLAAAGEAPIAITEPFRWIVRYHSPAGWRTYSPTLTLDPAVGHRRWARSGADEGRAVGRMPP